MKTKKLIADDKKRLIVIGGKINFFEELSSFYRNSLYVPIEGLSLVIDKGKTKIFSGSEELTFGKNDVVCYRMNHKNVPYRFLLFQVMRVIENTKAQTLNFHPDKPMVFGKEAQSITFALNKIATPKTILGTPQSYEQNKKMIHKEFKFPFVLKKRMGAKSKYVWRIDSEEDLYKKFTGFKSNKCWIIQEMIKVNYDIRVVVLNGKVLGAIKRPIKKKFATKPEKFGEIKITDEEKKLAQKATRIFGLDYAGVDIIRSKKGSMILEVNVSAGMDRFIENTGVDVFKEIVKYISKG